MRRSDRTCFILSANTSVAAFFFISIIYSPRGCSSLNGLLMVKTFDGDVNKRNILYFGL